jgi:hypothetical protein
MVPCACVALVLVLAGAVPAIAADASDAGDPLRSAPLLGGYKTLEALGIAADVPRAQLLPLLIRMLHPAPDGQIPKVDDSRDAFVRTLSALGRALSISDERPSGLALVDARDNRARSGVRDDLAMLGLELVEQRNTFLARLGGSDTEGTRAALARGGVDVLEILNRLNSGERIHASFPIVTVPLPLPKQTWERLLDRRNTRETELLGIILADWRASLFAYGLLGMDDGSRAWLISTPEAMRAAWENPGRFATAARSIRVRGGTLEPPGGADTARTWERITGAKLARPALFVRQILSRDAGRLAFFFDTMAQLDEPHVRFALTQTRQRPEPLRDLYAVVSAADSSWDISDRPFIRAQFDTPVVLRSIAVDRDGVPTGPRWRSLWNAVASGESPSAKTATTKWLQREGDIDAVWICDDIAKLPARERRDRLQRLLFAQRVFATPALTDAADLAFVLTHYPTYRALLLTLERIGIKTVRTHASAIRAAITIGTLDREKRIVALSEFQGALVLLDRLRGSGTMNVAQAENAASELFELPIDASRVYEGRVASWLTNSIAPGWQSVSGDTGTDVDRLLVALAGREARLTFSWESERYVTAKVDAEMARLQTGFKAMAGAAMGDVIAVSRGIERITAAKTIDELHLAVTALGGLLEGASVLPFGLSADEAKDVADNGRKAIRELLEIRKIGDLDKVRGRVRPLSGLLERMSADVLRTLAYVLSSSAEDLGTTPDLALRHDFGIAVVAQSEREREAPWDIAAPASDPGYHFRGSLLALDQAQSSAALRRLTPNMPLNPPTVASPVRGVLTHTLVLADSRGLTDADRDAIAAALRKGRERIVAAGSAARPADHLEGLPTDTVSSWRSVAVDWTAANAPDELLAHFTLYEILLLGAPGRIEALDAWGVSQQLHSGCPCLQTLPAVGLETLSGRAASSEAASHFVDLSLRLAEEFSELRVPAVLLASVLALATQDLIDTAKATSDDDTMALSRAVRAMTRDQVSDYVAAVVGRGMAKPAGNVGGVQ